MPSMLFWCVNDEEIDWFAHRAGDFERLAADPAGSIRSEVFPGPWLDVAALITGDSLRVFKVLDQGLASPEHAAFVRRLQGG